MQVVLVGESQGGHVAARLADLAEPELLVLLASLPDVPEVARLRASGQATAIGWKVFAIALRVGHRGAWEVHASYCFVCFHDKDDLWNGRPGAELVVAEMGPRAYLGDSYQGTHGSFRPGEVREF